MFSVTQYDCKTISEILFLVLKHKTYYSIPSKTVNIISSGLGMDFSHLLWVHPAVFGNSVLPYWNTGGTVVSTLWFYEAMTHRTLHSLHKHSKKKNVTDKVINFKDANIFLFSKPSCSSKHTWSIAPKMY